MLLLTKTSPGPQYGVSLTWIHHPRDIIPPSPKEECMQHRLTMMYWRGEQFWLGKLLEHPEIMTQGETIEELEENLKDAYRMMVMEDVPEDYQTKEIAL
jgi:predicted RNase H-like HicB family nuclease